LLAAGLSTGKILVYRLSSGPSLELVTDRWGGHTARVTSIAWNAAGTHAVSGSLDTNVFVWSLASPGKKVKRGNAHKEGVTGVQWVASSQGDEGRIISVGGDAAVKTWRVGGLV
jgi:WD40 repeat protein